MTAPRGQAAGNPPAGDGVLRVEIHVRPRSATTEVAGTHDGALVVRVTQPAYNGQANRAALHALADALCVPHRSVILLRGSTARRKLVGIHLPPQELATARGRLVQVLARCAGDG